MAHSTEGFHGFVVRDHLADQYEVGPLFELYGQGKCPVCGRLHILAGYAGGGMDSVLEAAEHIHGVDEWIEIECPECASEEDRLFGKDIVFEFFRDDEPDFLRDTIVEIKKGITYNYTGTWTGPGNA